MSMEYDQWQRLAVAERFSTLPISHYANVIMYSVWAGTKAAAPAQSFFGFINL